MNNNDRIKKRLTELSDRAFERNFTTFSEFLNLDEISELKSLRLSTEYVLFGGYENAERCVAAFESGVREYEFPITCIKIEPLNQKFADKLNHRDFLGSLMNLGISRSTLGDIVTNGSTGWVFCLKSISEYILQNLVKIKHTNVKCELTDEIPQLLTAPPDEEEIIVSSLRADAVIASVCKLSRAQTAALFAQEKVFINSRAVQKESVLLKENDIISVRGRGKFIFKMPLRETKKGRIIVCVGIYR